MCGTTCVTCQQVPATHSRCMGSGSHGYGHCSLLSAYANIQHLQSLDGSAGTVTNPLLK